MGAFGGHGPSIGAICDPVDFSDVVEVPFGVLGARYGAVSVDLVAPGIVPDPWPFPRGEAVCERTFKDRIPWIVVRAGTTPDLKGG